MKWLWFLMQFAQLQAGQGRPISPRHIMINLGMPRSTVNRYLSGLKDKGWIVRKYRGAYALADTPEYRAVGVIALTPLELYGYYTNGFDSIYDVPF